jgi:rubrerythrin
METDGKVFYLKASEESINEPGKKLLRQLAMDEDEHRRVFEKIYAAIVSARSWPKIDVKPHTDVSTLFTREGSKIGKAKAAPMNEIEAAKTALDMESKSGDFYNAQLKTASFTTERHFYEALIAQEREHHLVLLDYLEFLQDPASYFVKTEHHSLDGG